MENHYHMMRDEFFLPSCGCGGGNGIIIIEHLCWSLGKFGRLFNSHCSYSLVYQLCFGNRPSNKMLKFLLVLSVLVISYVDAQPLLIQQQKLRFKLSGHGLPDKDKLGTTDPYVEIFVTENGSSKETKIGRTGTISDSENPTWGDIIEFDYDRSKGQRWHFKVKDHDNGREDDTVGKAWVIVDDYVDKGQKYTVNLHKKGTLTVESSEPVQQQQLQVAPQQQPQLIQVVQPGNPTPQLVQVVQPAVVPAPQPQLVQVVQPGVQPLAILNQPQKLRFQLSARGLEDLDIIGTVDPYVKLFYTDDTKASDQLFGRTKPISDSENPDFKEVFEFDAVRGKKQRWHFVVLDDDDNRRDDEAGEAFLDVDTYLQNGENSVLNLKKGQLIVKRA